MLEIETEDAKMLCLVQIAVTAVAVQQAARAKFVLTQ